jgi:hypothetical protein
VGCGSSSLTSFITNDLSFAAYLTMHGIVLIRAKKLGKTFKFEFENASKIEQLRYAYPSSESSKFDDAVRKLKKLLFGDN